MSELIQDIHKELYRQIYKELCEKGYMTRKDFGDKIKNKSAISMIRAMDGMKLYTYDDMMEEDGCSVRVIKPFNRDDI